MALKRLIQPLAGEYGMHNGEPQGALCPQTCISVIAFLHAGNAHQVNGGSPSLSISFDFPSA